MRNLSKRDFMKGATAISAVAVIGMPNPGRATALPDASIQARKQARKAASALRWFGEGYRDPEGIYDGKRPLDAFDAETLESAYEALREMEKIILSMK